MKITGTSALQLVIYDLKDPVSAMTSVNGTNAVSGHSNLLQDSRVEDFLNDKLQTIGDLDGLDVLLAGVLKQQTLLAQQVSALVQ